jgi:hypothetical protein
MVTIVGHETTCLGHRAPADRFALHKKRPVRKRPQKASQQFSRLGRLSQGDFNRGGTMCQHLCRIHLAPKSGASRPELIESLLYFVHGYLIEEILHISFQRILLVQRKLFDTKSCPWLYFGRMASPWRWLGVEQRHGKPRAETIGLALRGRHVPLVRGFFDRTARAPWPAFPES